MIDALIAFIPRHDARLFELLCGAFSTLSLLFAFSRRTVWLSKLFGTVTPADLGRAWRYLLKALELIQRWRDLRKATGGLLVLVVLLLPGCAAWPWTKTAWDIWREKCGKALVLRPEFQAEAQARKVSVDDLVEAACELSDVVAPFVRSEQSPLARKAGYTPADEAVAAAQGLGILPAPGGLP